MTKRSSSRSVCSRLGGSGFPPRTSQSTARSRSSIGVAPDALRRRVEALESSLEFTKQPTRGVPVSGNAVAAGRGDPATTPASGRPLVLGRPDAAGVSPHGLVVHPGALVSRGARPPPRRPPYVPGRPDAAHARRRGAGARATGRLRRRRVREHFARTRAVAVGRGGARPRGGRSSASRSRGAGELVETDGGTLLRMRVGSLDWTATVLAGLGCGFCHSQAEELRTSVRALGGGGSPRRPKEPLSQ